MNPTPIELAMIAAPIFASYVTRGRGSHEDAVNDARRLIEAAEKPLADGKNLLMSTREAAQKIYGFQQNFPQNWCKQFKTFCVDHWEDSIAPASSSFFVATHKNGERMFDFYDTRGERFKSDFLHGKKDKTYEPRGWDAAVVERIHKIYWDFRTRASKHKRVKVTKC